MAARKRRLFNFLSTIRTPPVTSARDSIYDLSGSAAKNKSRLFISIFRFSHKNFYLPSRLFQKLISSLKLCHREINQNRIDNYNQYKAGSKPAWNRSSAFTPELRQDIEQQIKRLVYNLKHQDSDKSLWID